MVQHIFLVDRDKTRRKVVEDLLSFIFKVIPKLLLTIFFTKHTLFGYFFHENREHNNFYNSSKILMHINDTVLHTTIAPNTHITV